MANIAEGGMIVAYEDIYKGLTEEERLRMLKADIPKPVVIGEANLTQEEIKAGEETLKKLVRLSKRAKREKRDILLTKEEIDKALALGETEGRRLVALHIEEAPVARPLIGPKEGGEHMDAMMKELITQMLGGHASLIAMFLVMLAVAAFTVSVITEVTKSLAVMKYIPTDLYVIALSIAVCTVAFLIGAQMLQVTIRWYMLVGVLVISFYVAFLAMFGWQKLAALWKRFGELGDGA